MTNVEAITRKVQAESSFLQTVIGEVERVIVGQRPLVEGMLTGLLADGHLLLEGVPGLAKSLAVETLALALGGDFKRIQFTPDLLPADLLGTQVYNPKTGDWSSREGPVFANFVLADEINRAPAKVQSALLEAMQERQVSLAGETRPLPTPFLVLATQNPLEQEGTYPLPEAQLDRFMLKLTLAYPSREEEDLIIQRMGQPLQRPRAQAVAEPERIMAARALMEEIYLDEKVRRYIVDLVFATRSPAEAGLAELEPLILYGASPRASLALAQAAKARAFFEGRGFVLPQDVKRVGLDVFRHRLITTYEAEAEGFSAEDAVNKVFDTVPVP